MTRAVYVNGSYEPYATAAVHAEDRGFLFADGVYEVCEVRGGCLIDERLHVDRLLRSLDALRIASPMSRRALGVVLRETVRRNRVRNGYVYLEVTRGAAPRDFAFPAPEVRPTIVCYARPRPLVAGEARAEQGLRVVTVLDIRWQRRDVKSVALLPNVLARQTARDAGADEAWFVDDEGFVTEGAACNAWIVTGEGTLITRKADNGILRGVTRTVLIELLRRDGLRLEERAFTVAEAQAAAEAFISAATSLIVPVVSIDGVAVGGGQAGPVAKDLRSRFHSMAEWSHPRILLT